MNDINSRKNPAININSPTPRKYFLTAQWAAIHAPGDLVVSTVVIPRNEKLPAPLRVV